jgi:hypothetical protein
LARADQVSNIVGVNLADGFEIERRVIAATTPNARGVAQSLGALQPLFFLLTDLFCPTYTVPIGAAVVAGAPFTIVPHDDGRPELRFVLPPRPEDIRDSLVAMIRRTRVDMTEDALGRDVPQLTRTIPSDVLLRIARHRSSRPIADEGRAPYWRVTFVSTDSAPRAPIYD